MSQLASYLELTKPRLLPLVLLSGLPALVMALGRWPGPELLAAVLGGTALAAGAANALNCYLERDLDARMTRTAVRPLPAGRLAPERALWFAFALFVLGPGLLLATVGVPAAAVAVAGILFYVFVYTLWLKPRSPAAVVVGGVSGAVAPLIADAAVGGSIGAAGWILFAIIFVWQPPHFWAITLYRRAEYEAAGFPLLLSQVGEDRVRRRIVAWIAVLVLVSLAPVALSLSLFYGAAATALGVWFLWSAIVLMRERSAIAARALFRVSLIYLLALFGAMIIDLVARGASA